MATPNRITQRGFSLLELLVVMAILVLLLALFATFAPSLMRGAPLERHTAVIMSMVAGLRQDAAVRQVHVELVLDYREEEVVALSRRRLTTFAFEDTLGSGNVLGYPSGGAVIAESRQLNLLDGKALQLGDRGAAFTIPWTPTFDVSGDYEGVALSFDLYPMLEPGGGGGVIAAMGPIFRISVAETRRDAVRLALYSGDAAILASTWVSAYRWCTIEIACSRYGISLYVDGRLDAAELPDGFTVPAAEGVDLRLGGFPCRIDNLELMALISSRTLRMDGAHLIGEGVPPELEVTLQARDVYQRSWGAAPSGPVTGPDGGGGTTTDRPAGLPDRPLPAVRHIYFDSAGRLDAKRHAGAVYVYLVSQDSGRLERRRLTFHPLGAVTWDDVDRFPWERRE